MKVQVVVLSAAALLSACGGGGGGGSEQDGSNPTATEAGALGVSSAAAAIDGDVNGGVVVEAAASTARAETVLVTPTNNGDGIKTSPVLKKTNGTVVSALEDLPEGITNSDWMKKSSGRLPLRIVLATGTYFLKSPWLWTDLQSGRSDSPITVEAQNPGSVVISGAKYITVPVSAHQGAARVSTDLTAMGLSSVDQLWVNGGRAILARAPNIGSFFYAQKSLNSWNGSTTLNDSTVDKQAFTADPASLTYLNGLTSKQKSEALLIALQSWTAGHHRVQEWKSNGDTLVSPPAKWAFLNAKFGFAQRYFIENVPTALDAAGEWYYDSATAKLTYLPYDAQKQADVVFAVPRVRQLLQLRAQASAGKWVEYINFKGLKFRYARVPMPAEGFNDGQAAVTIESAIQMDSVRNVTLSDCEVSRVGGYGIWLRQNVKNVTVSGCELYDMGAGGIKIGLAAQPVDSNATSYNTIGGNRIHATGFQFPSGVGVWVGQSSYNVIQDNLIGDTTYTGISVGWSWGYANSTAHHNTVQRNFLYNIMQGSLSDGGGIYTLGMSDGTVIKGNVIKNVRGFQQYGAGAWGLYNDEGSSDMVMDSNVVVGTDNGGYVMHYGRNITMSNNVLAHGDYAEVQITKAETVTQVTFDRNYIAPTLSSFIAYGASTTPQAVYDSNQLSSQYLPWVSSPKECGAGCTVTQDLNIQAGALLEVPTLTRGGSVVSLPAGMPQTWAAAPLTNYMSPATWWAVPAAKMPKRIYEFDAATADLGSAPAGMKIIPYERPELVNVIRTDSGEQCLAFKDSPDIVNSWEPYSLVETDYSTGTSKVTFTLKADAATDFIHEWRNYRGNPYTSGPRVVFSAARGIEVNFKKVAPLPVGQWIQVTVTSRQGANPTWDLSVKYADGSSFALANQQPVNADWTTTKAVFFISNAKTSSTTCMGKITISNQ